MTTITKVRPKKAETQKHIRTDSHEDLKNGGVGATVSAAAAGIAAGGALGAIGGLPGAAIGAAIGGALGTLAGIEGIEVKEAVNKKTHK